jgi:hypothetical protein
MMRHSLYFSFVLLGFAPIFAQQLPVHALGALRRGHVQTGEANIPDTTAPKWTTNYAYTPDTGLSFHSSVYDPVSKAMTVFGGQDWGTGVTVTNAVLLNTPANGNGSWTTLIPAGAAGAPVARAAHTAVYDPASNRMIVFGGETCPPNDCTAVGNLNDVWVLTNANGQGGAAAWTQLNPSGTPPAPRCEHTAVYDSQNNRMIIFGGEGTTLFSDVWVLSNANGLGGTPAWTQLAPSGTMTGGLAAASAVYDPINNIMTVFGGAILSNTAFTNGVWTLSNANGLGGTPQWTNIVANGAAGSPAERAGHSAVYDSTNNRMILFGGVAYSGPRSGNGYNDVWVLLNANGLGGTPAWTELKPHGVLPGTRCEHTAVYDAGANQMMIFAGINNDPVYYVIWVLSHANGL